MKMTYSAAQYIRANRPASPYSTPTSFRSPLAYRAVPQHNMAVLFATMQSLNTLLQAFSSFAASPATSAPQQSAPSKHVGYSPLGEPRNPADALTTAKSMVGLGQGNHNGVIVHPNGPNGTWVVSWQSGGGHTTVHVDPKTGDGKVMYGDKPVGPTVAAYSVTGGQTKAMPLPKPGRRA